MISQPCSSPFLLKLLIPGELPALTEAIEKTMAVLPDAASASANKIELALAEALNNAVIHGCIDQMDCKVSLWVLFEAPRLEIGIADERGALSAAMLAAAEMPEQSATMGRGLALIKALCPDASVTDQGEIVLHWPVAPA